MKNKMMKMLAVGLMAVMINLTVNVADVAAHPKTVKVRVTKNGFSPATINVEKGHLLNLVFYRADNEGCGTEVVFPSLNIRKKLPLKKNVTVQITPKEAGEINFSCGMNMMKGTIIAE